MRSARLLAGVAGRRRNAAQVGADALNLRRRRVLPGAPAGSRPAPCAERPAATGPSPLRPPWPWLPARSAGCRTPPSRPARPRPRPRRRPTRRPAAAQAGPSARARSAPRPGVPQSGARTRRRFARSPHRVADDVVTHPGGHPVGMLQLRASDVGLRIVEFAVHQPRNFLAHYHLRFSSVPSNGRNSVAIASRARKIRSAQCQSDSSSRWQSRRNSGPRSPAA